MRIVGVRSDATVGRRIKRQFAVRALRDTAFRNHRSELAVGKSSRYPQMRGRVAQLARSAVPKTGRTPNAGEFNVPDHKTLPERASTGTA